MITCFYTFQCKKKIKGENDMKKQFTKTHLTILVILSSVVWLSIGFIILILTSSLILSGLSVIPNAIIVTKLSDKYDRENTH